MLRQVKVGFAGLALALSAYGGCSTYAGMKDAEASLQRDPHYARAGQLGRAHGHVQDAIAALRETEMDRASVSIDTALASFGDEGVLDDELRRIRAALDRDVPDGTSMFHHRLALERLAPSFAELRTEYEAKVSRAPYISKGTNAVFFGLSLLVGLAVLGYGFKHLLRGEE